MIIKGKITYECDDGFYKYYYDNSPIIVVNEETFDGKNINDSTQLVISICETEFMDKIKDVLMEKEFYTIGQPFLNFYGVIEFRSLFYSKSDETKQDFVEINKKIFNLLKNNDHIFPKNTIKPIFLGI